MVLYAEKKKMLSNPSLRCGVFPDSHRRRTVYGVCDTPISFDNSFRVGIYCDGNLYVGEKITERGDFFENSCCQSSKTIEGYIEKHFQNKER